MATSGDWRKVIWIKFSHNRFVGTLYTLVPWSLWSLQMYIPFIHFWVAFVMRLGAFYFEQDLRGQRRWFLCTQNSYFSMRLFLCTKCMQIHRFSCKRIVTACSNIKKHTSGYRENHITKSITWRILFWTFTVLLLQFGLFIYRSELKQTGIYNSIPLTSLFDTSYVLICIRCVDWRRECN